LHQKIQSGKENDMMEKLLSLLTTSSSLSSFIAERNTERQCALPQNYIVRLGKYKVK